MSQIVLCHQVIIPSWGYVDRTFNPIQDKWYLGNIILPSTVILLKCMKAITFEIVWLSRLDGAPCRKFTWDTGTPILPGPHIFGYKFQHLMISQIFPNQIKSMSGNLSHLKYRYLCLNDQWRNKIPISDFFDKNDYFQMKAIMPGSFYYFQ